jgi:hypothetical protein
VVAAVVAVAPLAELRALVRVSLLPCLLVLGPVWAQASSLGLSIYFWNQQVF